MSSTENSISDFLQGISMNEESQERIARAIKEEKLPYEVLKKYASKTKIFKLISKKLKINGFRPNTSEYNKRALSKLISYLSDGGDQRNLKLLWGLYTDSAVDYIINDLPNLNKLLDEVEYNSKSIADVMKQICEYSCYYDVSKEDIKALYEIWHIPRLEKFEDILLKSEQGNLVVKGLLKKTLGIEEKLEGLQSVLREIAAPMSTSAKEKPVEIDRGKISKVIEEKTNRLFEEKISQIEKKFKSLTESTLNNQREGYLNVVSELKNEIKNLKNIFKSGAVSIDKIKESVVENRSNNTLLKSKISQEFENIKEGVKKEINEQVTVIKENITQIAQESLYVSPLSKIKKKNREQKYKITSIFQLLESWSKNFDQTNYTVTKEQLFVQHQIFTQSSIVIVEDEAVLDSWLETLSWKSFCKTESVSPVWLRESDWSAGAEFLFEFEQDQPKFLKFKNFDYGLIDSYLLPSLELWLEKGQSPLKKVFLIPSQKDIVLSPRMSTLVSYQNNMQDSFPVLRSDSSVNSKPIFSEEAIGLSPKTFVKWADEKFSVDLNWQPLLDATSITIPIHLKNQFIAVAEALNFHLNTKDSVVIAAKTSIMPWIANEYDESLASEFLKKLEELEELC